MPGPAFRRHPNLPGGSVRVHDVPRTVRKLDREDIAREFGFNVRVLEGIESSDESGELGIREGFIFTVGEGRQRRSLGSWNASPSHAAVSGIAVAVRLARPRAFSDRGIAAVSQAVRVGGAG